MFPFDLNLKVFGVKYLVRKIIYKIYRKKIACYIQYTWNGFKNDKQFFLDIPKFKIVFNLFFLILNTSQISTQYTLYLHILKTMLIIAITIQTIVYPFILFPYKNLIFTKTIFNTENWNTYV